MTKVIVAIALLSGIAIMMIIYGTVTGEISFRRRKNRR